MQMPCTFEYMPNGPPTTEPHMRKNFNYFTFLNSVFNGHKSQSFMRKTKTFITTNVINIIILLLRQCCNKTVFSSSLQELSWKIIFSFRSCDIRVYINILSSKAITGYRQHLTVSVCVWNVFPHLSQRLRKKC